MTDRPVAYAGRPSTHRKTKGKVSGSRHTLKHPQICQDSFPTDSNPGSVRRRHFVVGATVFAAAGFLSFLSSGSHAQGSSDPAETGFEVTKTEAEWRTILSEAEYVVLREEATEKAYSSPLNDEKRPGTYHCAGCRLPLYASDAKFDSKTGWPSFFRSLENAIGTKADNTLFTTRTEVHCRRCGGHLGHIFDDGPQPTGLRHCLNGVALDFEPA